ncbi:glycosyl hydrolase family 65 protein [Aurantimonas sp. A3-2-R12]|uniref:glycosyl hydrolase family 65 protein n=1 Tax=Aurantimonas sp. A3-2-R12 TaxID=3114362 RepID=UPI002E17DBB8|nr:glycosyl hydrolase family 65 protein [Aurantimonas sp. A3-2-R12]
MSSSAGGAAPSCTLSPRDHDAVLFDLDGVLTRTASVHAAAWKRLFEALQSDVADIQQGTTSEGVHLGAMAGSVDLVERVSTGIEVKGDVLRLNPELPQEMDRLDMRIRYRGHSLDLRLTRDALTVRGRDREAAPISLSVEGKVDLPRIRGEALFHLTSAFSNCTGL